MARYPTEAERRDDLADELRARLLITKPFLRCPTDQEAELIATITMKHFHDLLWRSELNDGLLEAVRKDHEELQRYRTSWLQIDSAIADLVEARERLKEYRSVIE